MEDGGLMMLKSCFHLHLITRSVSVVANDQYTPLTLYRRRVSSFSDRKAKRLESHNAFFASFFSLVKWNGDEVITLFEKKNEERNNASLSEKRKIDKQIL